jgi:Pyruvate/2-oxoacid:ferredoxin oxidoreductase gamma subunit
MVKDEDVCLHCGLCAERCPTGAWDMQKFLLEMTHAGHAMPIESVNDFVVKLANVNGSGSASANQLFARSVMRMGVPVALAQHLPLEHPGPADLVRGARLGRGSRRRGGVDMMVAMNPQTWDKDVASIDPGGYLFYDSSRPHAAGEIPRRHHRHRRAADRDLQQRELFRPRQRQLFKNIIYVGALAALLDIDPRWSSTLLGEQFKGKDKLIAPNIKALQHRPRLCPRAPEMPARPEGAPRRPDKVGDRILSTATPRRRSARLWRRDGLRLVSDHAVHLAGGSLRELLQEAARRSRRPARSASPSCRPRTSSPRSAW